MASVNYYIDGNNVELWLDGLSIYDADGYEIQWTRRVNWTLYNVSTGNSRQADSYVDISPGNTKGGYYTFSSIPKGTFQATVSITNAETGAYVTSLASEMFSVGDSGGESGGESGEWSLVSNSIGLLGDDETEKEIEFTLNQQHMCRYAVTFNYSGIAKVYSLGSVDVIGYMGTSSSFDYIKGEPTSYSVFDDESSAYGNNFSFSLYVQKGITYYLWVRSFDGIDSGTVWLYIEPPTGSLSGWRIDSSWISTTPLSNAVVEEIFLESYVTYRRAVIFEKSGYATFCSCCTDISVFASSFISVTPEWDDVNATPKDSLKGFDPIEPYDNNFTYKYRVTAGETYYVWVRKRDTSQNDASTILYIGPPSHSTHPQGGRPNNFSWTYPKEKGGEFNLTATEWNSFCARFNAFLQYKYQATLLFEFAHPGDELTASMFNNVWNRMQSFYGSIRPNPAYPGGAVTADMMNSLVSYLNSL